MTTTIQCVPRLRFPEFTGEWEEKKLGDVFNEIVVGFVGTVSTHYCDSNIGIQFIRTLNVKDGYFSRKDFTHVTKEFHNKNEKSKIHNGDILIARVGVNMGLVCTVFGLVGEANSANVVIIKRQNNTSSEFFTLYLSSDLGQRQIQGLGAGGAQEVLNISVVKKINVPVPSYTEQKKIASFLSAVDSKIEALAKKKSLLEQYKKGMMQKLFSQEIRFKDDQGNEFPEWEEKRLGDVLDYLQPTKYLVTSTEYSDTYPIPVLTAGKTFILGYTNEEFGIFNTEDPVIIFDDFTTAFQFVDFRFKAKSSAMKILKCASKEINIRYVYEAMRRIKFPIGEHKRYWISEYQREKIPYPSHKEQKKIADFLLSVDSKIDLVEKKLKETQTFKKGLLQQMFV